MKKCVLLFIFILTAVSAFAGGKTLLDNGVTFIEINRDYTETLSVVAFIRGGTVRETPADNGVGSLFSSVWVKSSELLKKTEFYGGGIYASVGSDFVEITFSIPSEYFEELIGHYRTFLTSPKLDETIFANEKTLQIEGIKASEDNAESKAFRRFMAATYGGHPYGLNSEGTAESVTSLSIKDLEKYGQTLLQGANMTVAVAGKYSVDQLAVIREIFAAIPAGELLKTDCSGSSIEKDSITTDTTAGIKQAKLYIGYTAPSTSNERYPVIKVISDVLGGGMSSRYFNTLRKDKGYAYSVGAAYPSRICASRYIAHIGLDEANIKDAIETIDSINKSFVNDLTEAELESVKNYMLGRILIDSQTNAKQAWYACFFENAGLGSGYFTNYINVMKGVTLDDVKKSASLFSGTKTVYILRPEQKGSLQ